MQTEFTTKEISQNFAELKELLKTGNHSLELKLAKFEELLTIQENRIDSLEEIVKYLSQKDSEWNKYKYAILGIAFLISVLFSLFSLLIK